MHIVLCLDDKNGMLFNKRRISADKAASKTIAESAAGRLWVNSYSAKLFADMPVNVDEDFLDKAENGDTCFVESLDFASCLAQVETITIYRWNRHYPSDVKLPDDLLADWTLAETMDFPGNSHDIITKEKYVR